MSDPTPRHGRAILVVEDDVDVRESLVEAVESTGRRVFAASDGQAALRILEKGGVPRPCLVMLDWRMSPMGGEEFLRRLQQRPDAAQLPIVVISGSRQTPPGTPPLPGVVAVLQKPFGIEKIRALLDEHG
jgi:CheY-like chemotaxis protein